MQWIEPEGPDAQTDTIFTSLYGVSVAQVVGQNPFDGLTVFGLVFDPEEEPVYLTRDCAERVVACLFEALAKANELLDE